MEIKRKTVPYGIANFEELRSSNCFFVDKTGYIRNLEQYKVPVFLRPRRFGKTLWCSILECYYDIKRKDKFDELFIDTEILKNPTDKKNSYIVLRFNFSTVAVKNNIEFIEDQFNSVIRNALSVFLAYYEDYFKDAGIDLSCNGSQMLERVLSAIKKKNLPPMYLIIDEYDNFTNQLIMMHSDELYNKLTTGDSFFRTFFKAIKAGTESQGIGRVFITGVLPITIDDLTSGFNIAEIITLEEETLNMLGFTQAEVDKYVDNVFELYKLNKRQKRSVKSILRTNYNGYRFLPDAPECLYNSTILTYFLKRFAINNGKIPHEIIDENLRTDVSWIRRLTSKQENARQLLENIILKKELPYDNRMLRSKFNMNQFFEKDFYPISLFYLGMMTFKNEFLMELPNQTMTSIFTEYFSIIEDIEVSKGYTDMFSSFMDDLDINKLFKGYWDVYVKRLPAQIFDKVNENFYRTTFFELCTRYLAGNFTFSIEAQYPCGRSDFEMLGKYHTRYKDKKFLVEFKYLTNAEGRKQKILKIRKPRAKDVEQVKEYEKEILREFPEYNVTKSIIYIMGNKGIKCFSI